MGMGMGMTESFYYRLGHHSSNLICGGCLLNSF